MIYVYYRGGCTSSRKAFVWFKKYGIKIEKKKLSKLSKHELLELLTSSDEGISYIIKRPGKNRLYISKVLEEMMDMTLNEALDYLLSNSDLLPTPIIMDEKNFLIGYNENEIRKFLPKELRRSRIEKLI